MTLGIIIGIGIGLAIAQIALVLLSPKPRNYGLDPYEEEFREDRK